MHFEESQLCDGTVSIYNNKFPFNFFRRSEIQGEPFFQFSRFEFNLF